jgi:branched-chain amino acid transport system substrate-binding protein
VVVIALTGTACAGAVGKDTTAAGPGPGAPSAPSAVPAPGSGQGTVPAAAGQPVDTGTTGTTIVGATSGPTAAGGAAATGSPRTGVSGPAAVLNRQSAASAGPLGGGGGTSAAGQGGSSTGGGSATGPGQSSSVGGGAGDVPGGGTPSVPGTTTGVTKDTITIGLMYPKTGFYTGLARNAPAATQAAFDEAGPINGRRVVLKYYDDGSENASTIQLEEKRAKDEVFALISVVSESNVVLAPLADQHKVPAVIGNIDQKVALPLTYVFPLYAYWARMATILPSFIKNGLNGGGKKIGVVYETTSTATDAKNAFKDKAKELGLNVVFEQPIAVSQSACANEVANLQAHGVELVFMMNGPLGAICMLRDARALGYKPTWTGVGTSWSFNVVAQASGGGADGIKTISTTTTLETPAGRHYAELMRKVAPNSGADDDDITMLWYALTVTTIEALRRAGPDLTREGFVETMETKMNGYDSGYLPPPTFGPKVRYGPTSVGISACCTAGKWTTPQQGWRATF